MAARKTFPEPDPAESGWRQRLHEVIFEADTPIGRAFDVGLLVAIVVSVIAVMFESVSSVREAYGPQLRVLEWVLTILFTIEYVIRLVCVRRPWKYATSFFGIVDLLAILPTYLSMLFVGAHSLLVIRALRLLRVFRVLKLGHLLEEAQYLIVALRSSMRKILVFLSAVVTMVLIVGALMHLIEGEENGFTSIPQSMYWAVVTMTTVGYGDIAPHTNLGKFLASLVMIMGYGIIAVPTGIVTVEMARGGVSSPNTQACPSCMAEGHPEDAKFCYSCGEGLQIE